jgi:hypothetical protein
MLKRHTVKIETSYAGGIYDGDEYHDLVSYEDETGRWVLAKDVEKLEDKIKRMQKRIDKLEGRVQ